MLLKNKQYQLIVLALYIFLMNTAAFAQAPRDPDEYFFNQSLGDLQEELENAKEQNKLGIMIFFEQKDCPFCYRMKTTILNRPDVQEFFRKYFVLLKVDIEGDLEMVDFDGKTVIQKDFAFKEHRVRATPVLAFFDLTGKRVVRYIGAPGSAEEFLLLGQYVIDRVYEKMSFTRFKREAKEKRPGG